MPLTLTQLAILADLASGWTITIAADSDTEAMLIAPSEDIDNRKLSTRVFQALHREGCLEELPRHFPARRRYGIRKDKSDA